MVRALCRLVLIMAGVMSASHAAATPDAPRRTLTLGVFAFRPLPVMQERYSALGRYLSDQLPGVHIRVQPLANEDLEAALQNQQVDFVLTNPTHYIKLREHGRLSGALATMVVRQGDRGVHGIGSVIVKRKDRADIRTLQDVAGRRVAIAGKHFLGTYMAPAAELLREGVDLDGITWVETTQPVDQVVTSVLAGNADVGFMRTGVLEDLEREGKLAPGELEVLRPVAHPGFAHQTSTRLYPDWPFLSMLHVDAATSQRVASALMALNPEHPAAVSAGIFGFTIPADYASVEQAMRELHMAPFEAVTSVRVGEVWKRYRAWIIALGGATGLVFLLAVGLVFNTRRLLAAQKALEMERAELKKTSAQRSYLLEASPVMIYTLRVTSEHAEPAWISGNITRLLGYTPEEALKRDWWIKHLHPDDRAQALAHFRQLRKHGEVRQTFRFAHKQGQYLWLQDELRLLYPINGRSEAVGVWRDITQAKESEDSLRLAASVFANSYDAILVTDSAHRIVDANPAFTRITGRQVSEVLGQTLNPLALPGEDNAHALAQVHAALDGQGHWQGELALTRYNGSKLVCALSASSVRHGGNQVSHHVVVFSDISHLKAHQAELDRLAHYDPLTGVPNRRMLVDRLNQAVARARRSGKSLAVCYLDLDDFKPVNDRLGHAMGDRLLVTITQRLQLALRGEDTLARLGGDEFVLLLSDLGHPSEWQVVLERVLTTVKQPVALGDVSATVSASVGVTLFPSDDVDADTLLRHADQAMYRAKQAGRNQHHLFDLAQDREVQVQRELVTRLAEARTDGELRLFYQPKVDLDTGQVVGAEALIRWQHPEKGLLPPAAFLWHMDGTDLEVLVGEWVIETALAQITTWKTQGDALPPGACISVNLSGTQLLKPGFRPWLQAALQRHPVVRPGDLELEILESAALADMETAALVMAQCRELGVRFALDDFGTGYSSLAYFRKLPVDLIKIDQSFVRNMLTDTDDHGIVQSVVYLAQAFRRPVIAEGVATLDHAGALLGLGCHLAQGFGIGHPMPATEWPKWVAHWHHQKAWKDLPRGALSGQ
jgi:diguanylate cyclase (GGDEF)-like protein/PAS domain S-box-containing protein